MLGARSLVVIVVVASASLAHADDKKFTLADLKALVAQNGFKEAVDHLGDIPPAQRSADWIDVGAAAAGGVLATLDTEDGSTLALIDRIDREYPQLLKAPKYTKPRAELGYKGLEGCFAQSNDYWSSYGLDNCLRLGVRFVDNSNGDRSLALKVAKAARKGTNASSTVAMFKRALGGKDDATTCKDEDLRISVIGGLGLPPDDPNAIGARAIMATCWADLKDPVIKAFEGASKGSNVRKNTCDILMAKSLLTGLDAKFCAKK